MTWRHSGKDGQSASSWGLPSSGTNLSQPDRRDRAASPATLLRRRVAWVAARPRVPALGWRGWMSSGIRGAGPHPARLRPTAGRASVDRVGRPAAAASEKHRKQHSEQQDGPVNHRQVPREQRRDRDSPNGPGQPEERQPPLSSGTTTTCWSAPNAHSAASMHARVRTRTTVRAEIAGPRGASSSAFTFIHGSPPGVLRPAAKVSGHAGRSVSSARTPRGPL